MVHHRPGVKGAMGSNIGPTWVCVDAAAMMEPTRPSMADVSICLAGLAQTASVRIPKREDGRMWTTAERF